MCALEPSTVVHNHEEKSNVLIIDSSHIKRCQSLSLLRHKNYSEFHHVNTWNLARDSSPKLILIWAIFEVCHLCKLWLSFGAGIAKDRDCISSLHIKCYRYVHSNQVL